MYGSYFSKKVHFRLPVFSLGIPVSSHIIRLHLDDMQLLEQTENENACND